ncbi:MAG: MFS transporter [Solirubrobacteraceae bacterium MAG38_C4-C5]|nr:MFS transporter [Candidatus Siliceabacter maunaloa]
MTSADEGAVARRRPQTGARSHHETQGGRRLSGDERRRIAILALPTVGFALSITVVTTYVPVVVSEFVSSSAVIGVLIAIEGLLALVLPPLVGARSDSLRTRLGGRLPFLLAGTPLMALALVMLGVVGAFTGAVIGVTAFFAGYYLAYEPYRALYPDLVDDEAAGRAQSGQAVARGLGTAVAMVGGGVLLALGQAVPFVAAAIVVVLTTGAITFALLRRSGVPQQPPAAGARRAREAFGELWRTVRYHPPLRRYLVANALWEGGVGAIKTFVILWITVGLGLSLTAAAGVLGGAAVCILAGAALAGKLADRFGAARVMQFAAAGFGAPMVIPFLSREPALLVPAVPVIATCGGIVMALPYALLIPMMSASEHGLLSGFYSLSRGLGLMIGPLLAGAAIEILRAFGDPTGTQGYAAVWVVAGGLLIASIPLARRLQTPGP